MNTGIDEYRATHKYINPTPKKRPRYPPNGSGELSNRISDDGTPLMELDNVEDDDEVKIVSGIEPVTSPKRSPVEKHLNIEAIARRFNHPRITTSARRMELIIDKAVVPTSISKSGESSPDELAPKEQDMMKKLPTKRPVTPSPSLSKRGDIRRTIFGVSSHAKSQGSVVQDTAPNCAAKIIGNGLCIMRAVSGIYKYEADKAGSGNECFLKPRRLSYILLPETSDGRRLEEYTYCTINLEKANRIMYSSKQDCHLVSIIRSADATITAPAKLIIELGSSEDLERFVHWAKEMKGTVKDDGSKIQFEISEDKENKVRREFACMMTKANKSIVRRDPDPDPRGDDIKLIEYNERQARSTNPPQASTRQVKAKNAMRPHASTSQSKAEVTVIPDDPKPNSAPRELRTTRSTFALKSPSPDPDFERWTAEHEGWDKRWRNSLVFPPHGKSRATVDKEDIPRLDEGEFLNDNLIIFYLRYLQHSLEAERPDLARRIYFQNTFFYEKLKTTRTSQGINYDSVKAWTSKIDLFTKDYIIVPINEFSHWYVAIIYNAPKLLPSSDRVEVSDTQASDTITIEEDADDSGRVRSGSPHGEKLGGGSTNGQAVIAADSDMTDHLSQMSICSPRLPDDVTKQTAATPSTEEEKAVQICHQEDIESIRDKNSKAGPEQSSPQNGNLRQKKTGKKNSIAPRKYSLDQPKIITLDSLGLTHSPACSFLKQYLVAELKDKKGFEIPNPKSLGMTAKFVPQQTNHCDCGLFLLGYIREFLKDPDVFIRSLLQHDTEIKWDLNPSQLRNEIRDLIFKLQEEQQRREDALQQEKRNKAERWKKRGNIGAEQQSYEKPVPHANKPAPGRYASGAVEEDTVLDEVETVPEPRIKSPIPKTSRSETERPLGPEESHHISGSYPRSPTIGNTEARSYYATTNTGEQGGETQEFISLLPVSSSPSDSNPKLPSRRSIDVDDLEAQQMQRQQSSLNHHDRKPISSPVEIDEDTVQYLGDRNKTNIKPGSREAAATSTKSPHFAGRKQGDRLASAKLREDAGGLPRIVDISD